MGINKVTTISIFTAMLATVLLLNVTAHAGTETKSGSFYEIKITTASKDGKTTATIKVTGKNGYKTNKDYPWKLTIKSGPGITEKRVLKKGDAKNFDLTEVVFEVTTDKSDTEKVLAELKLGMCDPKQCKMEKVPLSW